VTISLDEITALTLRVVFKPFAEEQLRSLGARLPTPWNPTDEELQRLSAAFVAALQDGDDE